MGSRIDKFVRKRQAVKADRSTKQGIAGHQAASKALGNAAGWKRTADSLDFGPITEDKSTLAYRKDPDTAIRKKDYYFTPGSTLNENNRG
jgi:hypothetical protein